MFGIECFSNEANGGRPSGYEISNGRNCSVCSSTRSRRSPTTGGNMPQWESRWVTSALGMTFAICRRLRDKKSIPIAKSYVRQVTRDGSYPILPGALLEYLRDFLLPLRASIGETQPLSELMPGAGVCSVSERYICGVPLLGPKLLHR